MTLYERAIAILDAPLTADTPYEIAMVKLCTLHPDLYTDDNGRPFTSGQLIYSLVQVLAETPLAA